ncbi:flagellar biosynthetic protein FliQ [Pseudidiomarina gelatinasegens]|jgi:flagellar biosynthetic protein FliQ|uniref:Flagellar biosynthetic protein FliQ n=1 Tax=Pseudidiomarina gelatinasegens TaxID=2487740 RepID=A0A443YZJ4_9GAMM|nr:flagellar biosynthesis protein FliQ [Pseudidiomarina gelatinasegens]RWU09611.1 flagellar biosynthetic protein FliQ [Pseudidiomarina gelatinasegens]|tara:strand:- start:1189 stop:1458 length:270 start_codon:yes stop_codon:yes gene_type:complete
MTPEQVMSIAYQGMLLSLYLAGPLLLTALLLGLLISLFQAATQINEMTLSFIPKILGVLAVLVILGPYLLQLLIDFTSRLFTNIPAMIQ